MQDETRYETRELTETVELCKENGRLNPLAIGWSRVPVQICNLKKNFLRKKYWAYWCITGPDALFSVTISSVDYADLVFAYFLDFSTGEFVEKTITIPFHSTFGKGIKFPESPMETVEFENEEVSIQFKRFESGSDVMLRTHWKDFQGRELQSEILVTIPANYECLNVVVPWDHKRYQFTSKQNCLPAKGYFELIPGVGIASPSENEKSGSTPEYLKKTFEPETSFACLDYGRGVWPYRASWNWGSFSGRVGTTMIGLNIGGKWTDHTGISENSVYWNGKLYKIPTPIEWTYNRKNFKAPWTMKSAGSDWINLEFQPFFERKAISNMILIYSEVHQCFGRYSGKIKLGSEEIRVENIIGWAEEHKAR
jgi:hypothetical protein